jgi:hypothetical protein
MKWAEFEQEFTVAMHQVEGVLDRTVKVCEHFEGLLKEIEAMQHGDQVYLDTAAYHLHVLDKLPLVEDKENIPLSIMFKAAEIFSRASYVLTVLSKVGTVVQEWESTNQQGPPMPSIPKEMLH